MLESLETTVDHVRGGPDGRLILEYGDYECPYSRRAFRGIQRVEGRLGDRVQFAFRHFPLTDRHPHALAAAAAAEASALQGRFCGSEPVRELILRDMESGIASGEVLGTPTLFIDGVVYRGPYDADTLFDVVTR